MIRRRDGSRRMAAPAGDGGEIADAAVMTEGTMARTVADLGWMEIAAARMDGRRAAKKPETVDGGRRRTTDEEDGTADVMAEGRIFRAF